ncbi:MAG: class I SAM-dependent methyltransferase [Xanthobacteraceae bacterium]
MSDIGRYTHWENVYQTKAEREVSWFEENPAVSLELIHATGVTAAASIVDIGGGASRLVDALLDASFGFVTVLDVSEHALAVAQARLGSRSAMAKWIAADVTAWRPSETYDVWHDRAAFHFLTDDRDRAAYAERVAQAVRRGGHVIIGTFAPDGPERCSGLLVLRHDAASLGAVLGSSFSLVESRNYTHPTPMGTSQRFQFSRFRRLN